MSITRLNTNSLGGILRATYSSYTGSASVTTVSGKTCVRFLTSGTITIDRAGLVWALVVAGGGGSGHTTAQALPAWNDMSGGGAGGQAIEVTDFFLPVGIATVTVGGGGAGSTLGVSPVSGNASRLANLAAIGGGSTGNYSAQPIVSGNTAGAGGYWYSNGSDTMGSGGGIAQNITITGIGYVGGVKTGTFTNNAGGGAGAGGNGSNGSGSTGGAGGTGYYSSITGSSVAYGGGGGGGGSTASTGGAGGGGSGSASPTAGSINTGGGGGGRYSNSTLAGVSGGSGIVIILFG